MLSILIPTYNYNTVALVKELYNQTSQITSEFEIIVLDDCSNNETIIDENNAINTLENCCYLLNSTNLGRGLNRNKLVSLSKYNWLLIMDCDTYPKDNQFIRKYIDCINSNKNEAVFGGIVYQENKPKKEQMLRWTYGKERESVAVNERLKNPYRFTLTSNLLIKKDDIERCLFPDYLKNYGFEDLVLVLNLEKNNIVINQIENPTFHLGLETSETFIKKTETALTNLKWLMDNGKINPNDTKIGKYYAFMKSIKLNIFFGLFFNLVKKNIIKNLTSDKPSLLLFDVYKLGFISNLK